MPIASLHPFADALASLVRRQVMPTSLNSSQIRGIEASIKRQSFFSAQTTLTDYLDGLKADITSIVNPLQVRRADRVTPDNPEGLVTTGFDPAAARLRAKEVLAKLGYAPGEDIAGTLQDLSSDRRINLVIKTNVELAQGAGHMIQQNDPAVLEAFPAIELVRFEDRDKPRDWEGRWRIAARAANDPQAARVLDEWGRMAALKDSGVWASLGDSGLFDDALDNPFPPFAFGSGMWTQDVAWDDAELLGLVTPGTEVKPREINYTDLFNTAVWAGGKN
jgi:hypothetical protein